MGHKPKGYWQNFENLERELRAFIAAHGQAAFMPSTTQLKDAGQRAIVRGIYLYHGSPGEVAARLGLTVAATAKPRNYWTDFDNLEREMRTFLEQQGWSKLPSSRQMRLAGRSDLLHAIRLHGGASAVAQRLGLRSANTQKPKGYWGDFFNLERDLRAFLAEQGLGDRLPGPQVFLAQGRHDLLYAMRQHGGMPAVAKRLALQRSSQTKPPGYWQDFLNLESELRMFLTQQGVVDHLPGEKVFQAQHRRDLVLAIRMHGGMRAVAKQLVLALRPDRARKERQASDRKAKIKR